MVLAKISNRAGSRISEKLLQESINPTAAGMNSSGMICRSQFPLSQMAARGSRCVTNASSKSKKP